MVDQPSSSEDLRHPPLDRVLNPRTIAIVGATDTNPYAINSKGTLDSEATVFYVNPRHPTVFGRETFSSLSAIGEPIDAVFSLMSAERTVDLVEEASGLGAGGIVTIAGGFAELGSEGQGLQDQMRTAAIRGNMPIIGPNGVGYINVPKRLDLTLLTRFERRPGGVSIISHTGAALEAIAAAGWRAGGIGLNLMISAGNEPVTDMADYLEYVIDDPQTRVICLIVEKIRRPEPFFAAAARARSMGKPIIAIKLARTERTQRMAHSHTGALTGDAWVYEQAFKQAGILRALEVDELVDRVQFLEQLPTSRWGPVRGVCVLTATGGFAAMAGDLAAEEAVDMPEVERLSEWIGTVVPGATIPNPLDLTGFAPARPEIMNQVLDMYFATPEFDAHMYMSHFSDWDHGARLTAVTAFAERAQAGNHPAILSPFAGHAGRWLDEFRQSHGVAIGNGLLGSLRGLNTMATFVRSRPDAIVRPAHHVEALVRPDATPIHVEEGLMLPFVDTMELLSHAGIPVAPYHIVSSGSEVATVPFDGPYVVKLGDIAHRTELKAVRLGVRGEELREAVDHMRTLAKDNHVSDLVVVQAMIPGSAEAFIGLRGMSELGPIVAFGLGGVLVEILHRVSGRLAPLSGDDAGELLAEFDDIGALDGVRGQQRWDRAQLRDLLVVAGQLAAGGRHWIETLDINPLINGPDGIVAVDGLCLLKPD